MDSDAVKMSDSEKTIKKFREVSSSAYDLEKALDFAKLQKSDIDDLREKLLNFDNVPKSILDHQLLPFLANCKNDKDKAVNMIVHHYIIKKECPEFFFNRDVRSDEIQHCLINQDFVILPSTPDNCTLILFRLSSFEPKDYNFDAAAKTYIMTFETAIFNNGPKNGIVGLIDMRGSRFGHLFQPSITSVRKGLRLLQEGCPVEVQRVHVLNTFPFVNAIMAMIKPFISATFLSKIHWHTSDMDYEKFYEEHIPKPCLPSDYGGDLDSVEELHKKHKELLMAHNEYFVLEEKQMNLEF